MPPKKQSCTRHCRGRRTPHAETSSQSPDAFSVADRTRHFGFGVEPVVGQVPHARERLEHSTADFSQLVFVHRDDADHPRRRDRLVGGRRPGAVGRRGGGIAEERLVLSPTGGSTAVHGLWIDRRRLARRRCGRRVQWADGHSIRTAAVRGDAWHVQHCSRANDALDRRVSDHLVGAAIWIIWAPAYFLVFPCPFGSPAFWSPSSSS